MWERGGEIRAFFHNPVSGWKAVPVLSEMWSCHDRLDILPGTEPQFVSYPAHSLLINAGRENGKKGI